MIVKRIVLKDEKTKTNWNPTFCYCKSLDTEHRTECVYRIFTIQLLVMNYVKICLPILKLCLVVPLAI